MNGNRFPVIHQAVAIVALAMLFGGVESIQGQMPPGAAGASQSSRPMMIDEAQAGGMMTERQQMMASMRALDQTLDELIARIDTARDDDEKVDAIAAVVKAMAAQRAQMREQMMGMQSRMMGHMMEHMTAMAGMSGMSGRMNRGQTGAAPSMMDNCPMMKEMVKEATESGHGEHHPQN
jgi:hypothetical protein